MANKTVRVLAGAALPQLRKVNIITSARADVANWDLTEADDRRFETVQDSGGTVPGLKTVCIADYDAGGGGDPDFLVTEEGDFIVTEEGDFIILEGV